MPHIPISPNGIQYWEDGTVITVSPPVLPRSPVAPISPEIPVAPVDPVASGRLAGSGIATPVAGATTVGLLHALNTIAISTAENLSSISQGFLF